MQLFFRRPLCFFCFLFLITSFSATRVSSHSKIILLVTLLFLSAVLFVGYVILRKKDIALKIMLVFLSLLFVAAALSNTYFRIDIPQRKAEVYKGEHIAEMLVMSKDYSSENTSEYTVKIKSIDGEQVDIKALLVCGFDARPEALDRIYAKVEIADLSYSVKGRSGADRINEDDILIMAVMYDSDTSVYKGANGNTLLEKMNSCGLDGWIIGAKILREKISSHIIELFGEKTGPLASGLLMNDTSEMPSETVRDFRRTGVSHLLAVSGLHISLLIGFMELLLRKLHIPKGVRCALLSVAAFLLIVLAGFSMSACRSVFMLFMLYINYMFMEENDSPTSLFFAVFLIILFMPYSVYDLGLIMSFAATLGLVTVFPIVNDFLSGVFYQRLPHNFFFKILRYVSVTLAITLISNMFLLPIMWIYFGEISLASLPVNLIAAPIVAVLLPCIAVGTCLGAIPFVGNVFLFVGRLLSLILLKIIGVFSKANMATVSLNYDFVDYIMCAFVISMAVLMVIRLKKKWVLAVPCVVAVAAFSVSVSVFNCVSDPRLYYFTQSKDDMIIAIDDGSVSIIDFSGGNISSFRDAVYFAKENSASFVDSILLSHVHYRHISCMEYVMKNNIVNKIYIPYPSNGDELDISKEIYEVANAYGVIAILYEREEIISLYDGVAAKVAGNYDMDGHFAVNAAVSLGDDIIFYGDESNISSAQSFVRNSDILIFGAHGGGGENIQSVYTKENALVLFASKEVVRDSNLDIANGKIYTVNTAATELNKLIKKR